MPNLVNKNQNVLMTDSGKNRVQAEKPVDTSPYLFTPVSTPKKTNGGDAPGAAPATTVDPSKRKGLSEKEYFSISNYNQKTGMPVMPSTGSYTTKPTVPAVDTADTAATTPAGSPAVSAEDDLNSRTLGMPTTMTPGLQWTDVQTPVRGAQAPFQGRDMDSALAQLQAEYARNMGTYRPKTEEEIQQQASTDYASYYDQLRRAAGNEYAMNDLALLQQRAGLQASYDKSREASAKEYRQAYSQADRQLLSRGMQRSSYAGQTLANVAQQGAEAQQAIWDAQLAAEMDIDQRRQQLASNLANTMYGYDAGQAADVMSRVWDLRDSEYERQVNRANVLNSLASQLYGYLNQNNEVSREQHNIEANLRENQHQFDTGVAQARQGVEDSRTQYAATLAEEMRQYNNSQNMSELAFRAQYPQYGFTRGEDGRIILDESMQRNRLNALDKRYAELEEMYQAALKRPVNVTVGDSWGQYYAFQNAQKNASNASQTQAQIAAAQAAAEASVYNNLKSGAGLMPKSTTETKAEPKYNTYQSTSL